MAAYKVRSPGTFAKAATDIRDLFRAPGAAAIAGCTESRINRACDVEQAGYASLPIREALELDIAFFEAKGVAPHFEVYRRRIAEATNGRAPAVAPLDAVASLTHEHCEAVEALCRIVRPDSEHGEDVSPREAMEAIREIDDLIAEANKARAHLCDKANISQRCGPAALKRMLARDAQTAAE